MNNYREIFITLLWRLIPATGLGGFGWWLISTAKGGWGASSQLFFAMICFVGAAILIGSPIARLIAEPAGRLYYSERYARKTQPLYSIPKSKRAKGLYEEAISGLESIAKDYPEEVIPYIDMIEIAALDLKDMERADRIYQKSLSSLENEEAREILTQKYEAIGAIWKPDADTQEE